jgi:hypothetical protein
MHDCRVSVKKDVHDIYPLHCVHVCVCVLLPVTASNYNLSKVLVSTTCTTEQNSTIASTFLIYLLNFRNLQVNSLDCLFYSFFEC